MIFRYLFYMIKIRFQLLPMLLVLSLIVFVTHYMIGDKFIYFLTYVYAPYFEYFIFRFNM